ncbi:restriction endonuclease subunit S, partial [Streptomyces scabiei]
GDIGLLIPDEKKLDKSYMYHLISSAIIKNQLSKGAQQTKIRHTSPDKIKDCVAWIPDLNIQQKVGSFLDDIDLKIANNNAISKELESMAKTIYDYWFLQFEFPDKDGKPYKSNGGKMVWNDQLKQEIPEGWEVANLYRIAKFI